MFRIPAEICSGCGACEAICPKQCISLEENADGFLSAKLDAQECAGCGLCEKVCPFLKKFGQRETKISGLFYCADDDLRNSTSSGGICGLLGYRAIEKEQAYVGAMYIPGFNRVEHRIAKTIKDAECFKGSKYLQSRPNALYEAAMQGPCVAIGTPCQIAGLRKFIELKEIKHEIVLVDFYCHGVPSSFLWKKYLKCQGLDGIVTDVSFRDKSFGWSDRTIFLRNDGKEFRSSLKRDNDFFQEAFLSNLCLNRSCYEACPFKRRSSCADIRVGDAWGHDIANDDRGVSIVLAFTERGKEVFREIVASGIFVEAAENVAGSGQVVKGEQIPEKRNRFIDALKNERKSIASLRMQFLIPLRILKSISIRMSRFKRLFGLDAK